MVDKKDKKKKAKKTPKQKQKQKQSVVVNVNMTKPATRRRTLAKKTSDNRPLPQTPQSYGIPVQQSLQPSLNNITEYLRQKEGQENNRYVNILSAMKAIQRDEGAQATATQSERGAGTSTQAPAKGGGGGVEEALRYIDSLPEAPVIPLKDIPPDMRGTDFRVKAVETGKTVILKRSLKRTQKPEAASEPAVGKTFN